MSSKKNILITKASGEKELFSINKLHHSLTRAGADKDTIKRIEREILELLYPGITTKEIYRKAFSSLRKSSTHLAAKYKLKKAILELGPSGFPFEKYVSAILKFEKYDVQVGQIVQGHCISHEVDIVAMRDERKFMIECKFHSDQSRKCDIKIPLYIYSRFLDIEKAWRKKSGHRNKFLQGWVVTNTRFTTDALKYGTCTGLNLVSWNFPKNGSLRKRIDQSGLYPLTCLTTLTKKEKQLLLDKGIVLCMELCQKEHILEDIGIRPNRAQNILIEGRLLCQSKIPLK